MLVCTAQHRSRSDPQDLGDLVAVQLGTHGIQLLLLHQGADADLEIVIDARQTLRLAHVAGRAVRAGQAMQPGQQRPGVGDVSANRRVRPLPAPIAVEAQMQLNQPGNGLEGVLVEAHRLQPACGQLRADHLVVMEADAAVVLEAPGRRFADVVQQRGQTQHEVGTGHQRSRGAGRTLQCDGLLEHDQRVLVDVLVPVVLVDLELERRQLRKDLRGQAGLHEQREPLPGRGAHDQLDELVADPLGRDDLQRRRHLGHRRRDLGPRRETQLRHEPCGAHHPQRVVGEGHLRGAGGTQDPGRQISQPIMGVDELQRGKPHGHGVDGEVAPEQVVQQVVTEGDHGLSAGAVVGVRPIRRHLDNVVAFAGADGPEGPANVPVGVRPLGQECLGLLRSRGCGEVQVRRHTPQEGVAHGPTHKSDLVTGVLKAGAELGEQGQHRGQPPHGLTKQGSVRIGGRHERQG